MDLDNGPQKFLDLRGIACPLNWAKAKAQLEKLPRGGRLVLETDDPRAGRDIPGAAEAEGWVVIDVTPTATGDGVRISIER
jgi:TusA-related sulfurtransferase